MDKIKAIETQYKGYRFRSRLEARWAVWFDAMGIRYEYEKEGFDFDGERYLPDFWLPFPGDEPWAEGTPPIKGYWIEVKPRALEDRENKLLNMLACRSKHHAMAFLGNPWPGDLRVGFENILGESWVSDPFNSCACDSYVFKAINRQCHWCRTGQDPWFALCANFHAFFSNVIGWSDGDRSKWDEGSVENAFISARSARFEHGESGYVAPWRG